MGDLIHRNNASKDKIIASNVLMGQGNNKTDTVEKRIRDLEESGGGGGSDVEVTPLLFEGVHIADIKVNGEKSELYAPEGGGTGTITDVEVNGVSVVTEGVANIDLSGKQNVLTAGTNVSISGDVISATDTTYNDVVGATSEADGVHGLMPAPTSSDLDKAVRGDGTWGYAGAIDDVHVNGQSVVENKIAEITSYKEVTQAEYDALPSSKNSDGILYCIKDSNDQYINRGGFIDSSYVIATDQVSNNVTNTVSYTATQDCYVSTYNYIKRDTLLYININNITIQRGYQATYDGVITYGLFLKKGQTLKINTQQNFIYQQYIAFGLLPSSSWTSMHNYSKNEHIIGTWVDGSILYEKTIVYHARNDVSAPNVIIDTSIKHNLNCYVVYIEGIANYGQMNTTKGVPTDGNVYNMGTNKFYYGAPSTSTTSYNTPTVYAYNDGIHFMKYDTANANGCIVTVRYIKI